MQFQSQAHNSGVFTEGNDSNLTGRYGWVEGLVHRSYGIPASIEDLQNDMSATMMRRQSPFDYMSTMEYKGSIIWKIASCSFIDNRAGTMNVFPKMSSLPVICFE